MGFEQFPLMFAIQLFSIISTPIILFISCNWFGDCEQRRGSSCSDVQLSSSQLLRIPHETLLANYIATNNAHV